MRNIFAVPGWLLAYHKLLALFTVDIRSKINKLDRFSPKEFLALTDLFSSECSDNFSRGSVLSLSSMAVSHSPPAVAHDARDMRKRRDVDSLDSHLDRPACLAETCGPSKFCYAKKFSGAC